MILRTEQKDYGGVAVYVDGEDRPLYFAAGKFDEKQIEAVVAARATDRARDSKQAGVDSAIAAELTRRRHAVGDLYNKTDTEAVVAVFGPENKPLTPNS